MIPADLLGMLRCPQSGQMLSVLGQQELAGLNDRITRSAANPVHNQAGLAVREVLESGLIRADGLAVYPIRHGIPVLLAEEALSISAN